MGPFSGSSIATLFVLLVALFAMVLMFAYRGANIRRDEAFRSRRVALEQRDQARDDALIRDGMLATVTAERDTARAIGEFWKKSAEEWRLEALAQLDRNVKTVERNTAFVERLLNNRATPEREPDEFDDPPTVAEADRAVMEKRSAVAVIDSLVAPLPRAEAGEEYEDEDDHVRDFLDDDGNE